jgi:hypothetical protein
VRLAPAYAGLFGDELLLNVELVRNEGKNPVFQINKIKRDPDYLLPFSCVSLLSSQLTVLSENSPDYLSSSILKFINKPVIDFESGRRHILANFELTLYKKNKDYIYNQFKPTILYFDNFMIEQEVSCAIFNYIIWIFQNLSSTDKNYLLANLLIALYYYKENLQPFIKKIGQPSIDQRKRIAKTQVDFCSMLFNRWRNPPVLPDTDVFKARIMELETMLQTRE